MAAISFVLLFLSLCSAVFCEESANKEPVEEISVAEKSLERARGWGYSIEWTTLDEVYQNALKEKQKKPIMVIIHKTWCKACEKLKPKFSGSEKIKELSKRFSMINCQDDEEPQEAKYSLDGRYIPRIYFLDPIMNVLDDVYNLNPKFSKTKYYYSTPAEIITSMETVINRITSKDKYGVERGFGDLISWVSFEVGLKQIKETGRNMFLLIHKTWCGACKNLKPKIADSADLADLSTRYIMVNVEDDEEPTGKEYEVDGRYYPRIYFIDNTGKIMPQFWNEGSSHKQYKYYYGSAEEIISSMHRVLTNGNDVNEKLEKVGEEEQKTETPKKEEPKEEVKEEVKEAEKKEWGKNVNWESLKKDSKKAEQSQDNGWGADIAWNTLEEATERAIKSSQPVMLIIHKSWCGACKTLKRKTSASDEFALLTRHFQMVNIKDDDSQTDKSFDIDGAYAPRIFS